MVVRRAPRYSSGDGNGRTATACSNHDYIALQDVHIDRKRCVLILLPKVSMDDSYRQMLWISFHNIVLPIHPDSNQAKKPHNSETAIITPTFPISEQPLT